MTSALGLTVIRRAVLLGLGDTRILIIHFVQVLHGVKFGARW